MRFDSETTMFEQLEYSGPGFPLLPEKRAINTGKLPCSPAIINIKPASSRFGLCVSVQ